MSSKIPPPRPYAEEAIDLGCFRDRFLDAQVAQARLGQEPSRSTRASSQRRRMNISSSFETPAAQAPQDEEMFETPAAHAPLG
jgi:hypothetical protein